MLYGNGSARGSLGVYPERRKASSSSKDGGLVVNGSPIVQGKEHRTPTST